MDRHSVPAGFSWGYAALSRQVLLLPLSEMRSNR